MIKARKYVVKRHFDGIPKREDYDIVEYELPHLEKDEVLVKTEWISVDPYLRVLNRIHTPPYDQFSMQIGKVIQSKHPKYPVGTKVVSEIGWCDYGTVKITNAPMRRTYVLPELGHLPTSYGLGALGIPGATAYFGLLEVCKPIPGETVVVTGAAGAVGSLVGQIAKIKGCKVIGFAGSDEKVKYLKHELGFDSAFNYNNTDINKAVHKAAPDGVDCYFDNIGGEISSSIIKNMNLSGRVTCCGSISSYNYNPVNIPKATMLQQYIVRKQLTLRGFNVSRWRDKWHVAFSEIRKWIESGEVKVKEHIVEGFDNVFDAFVSMLDGANIGKALIKM